MLDEKEKKSRITRSVLVGSLYFLKLYMRDSACVCVCECVCFLVMFSYAIFKGYVVTGATDS